MTDHAIVLAAGAARRFGGGKLTAPYRGRPLIHWSIGAALACPVETVTVILGADADRVAAAVGQLRDPRLRTVMCADWTKGMSASLRCGIASLPKAAQAAVIFLADMPLVSSGLALELLSHVQHGAPAAIASCEGRPAHPVAIARDVFPILDRLTGDRGARTILEALAGTVRVTSDDRGGIVDIDQPADLSTLPE